MPPTFATIAIESHPKAQHGSSKTSAPLTAEKRKENKEKHEEKKDGIDQALAATSKNRSGARMVNSQTKINPYNVFRAEKAAECQDNAPTLHHDYFEEYKTLTDAEKDAYVEHFKDTKTREVKLRRDTPRGKIQDVANIVRNIKLLMVGLGTHVGVEGFFCIIRNSTDFHIQPQWFFTSHELEQYMPIATRWKWSTVEVGTKVEAFCVADAMSSCQDLLRTSKQKADFLKAGIREGLTEKLIAITGNPNAQMAYVWYEEDVVQKHGVELVGWTFPQLVNPSELSTSVSLLQELHDTIKNDTCKFVRLTAQQLRARKQKWEEDVAAGRIEVKHCTTRKDKGVKCTLSTDNEDEEDNMLAPTTSSNPASKRRRTTASVAQQPVIEEPDSDVEPPAPAAKPGARKPRGTAKAASVKKPAPKGKSASKKTPPLGRGGRQEAAGRRRWAGAAGRKRWAGGAGQRQWAEAGDGTGGGNDDGDVMAQIDVAAAVTVDGLMAWDGVGRDRCDGPDWDAT
ncbi:hypothetical protein DFH07DRAFT_780656 [Mycena maculata]|uniref:Uncharacterized protein n=1 Tax=Mycena maculata TaxID=230809 RepID=A0AAD7MU68_9AGAR|nr:hypothetical protein DFH07DRAFT_780656 [Mycena maculata]